MTSALFKDQTIHDRLHILGLSGIAVGLIFGKAILSISLLFSLLNLLILADFKNYWQRLRQNKFLLLVLVYFAYHFITLIWSDDISFGLHDIKVRSSLVLILFLFALKPLNDDGKRFVAYIFIASIVLSTLINFTNYVGIIGNKTYDDIRGMSLFGSHVRFALLTVLGIVMTFYTKFSFPKSWLLKLILIVWLVFYTYYSQVITGYLTLSVVAFSMGLYYLYRFNKVLAFSLLILSFLGSTALLYALFRPMEPTTKLSELPYATKEGHLYYHKPKSIQPETGEPTEIMISWQELEREWNKVSEIPFSDGRDLKGQFVQTTLIRYLASKGLNRDAEGISQLSAKDIQNIENGHASIYTKGILARWYGLRYQLLNNSDPNGHSLLERIEFWKAGTTIARSHPIFGVGIGDIQMKYNETYREMNSMLKVENWNRSHNMFLTTLITMGMIGLFLFLWFHLNFAIQSIKQQQLAGVLVVMILFTSYLIEDTLETQVGVSLAGFFLGFFNINPEKK
ncbi:MAG: hypothetical protein EP333_07465 [Bacteroidetes bacterium]|nr:MAG: hypothetical protein EP333_07465 [Bacteroidota bacterium]